MKLSAILNKALAGQRLTVAEGIRLFKSKKDELRPIMKAANQRRKQLCGEEISYVINQNLNLSNICVNSCLFCAFKAQPGDDKAYLLSLKEIKDLIEKALKEKMISEVCLVSGLHPDFELDYYLKIIQSIKEIAPQLHIHGITPEELKHALANKNLSFAEGYSKLKKAGLDSVPGTAAEILSSRVRAKICPQKLSSRQWIKAIKAAHQVGLKSSATIMYGHLENINERIEHLQLIREIQSETQGFSEFIPLSFIHQQTPLYKQGFVNSGASRREDLLMISIARLFLDNIRNIQTSWVKYGPKLSQLTLNAGANDLGGTLYGENISKEAGAKNKEFMTPQELENLILTLGRKPRQRTTIY